MKEFFRKNKKKLLILLIILIILIAIFFLLKFNKKQKNAKEEKTQIEEIKEKEYEEKVINLDVEGLTEESTPFIVKATADGEEDVYAKGYDKLVLNLVKGKEYKYDLVTAVNKDGSIYDTNVELTNNVKITKIENPTKEQIEESLNKISEFAKNIEDTEIVEKAGENIKNNETLPEEVKQEIETKVEDKKQEVQKVVENKAKNNNTNTTKPKVTVQEKPHAEVKPVVPAKPEPRKPENKPAPAPEPKPENKPVEKTKQKVWIETRPAKPAIPAKYQTVSYVNKNANKEHPNDNVVKVRDARYEVILSKIDRTVLDRIIIHNREEYRTLVIPRIKQLMSEQGITVYEVEHTLNKAEYKHTYQKEVSPAKPAVPAEGHWEWR